MGDDQNIGVIGLKDQGTLTIDAYETSLSNNLLVAGTLTNTGAVTLKSYLYFNSSAAKIFNDTRQYMFVTSSCSTAKRFFTSASGSNYFTVSSAATSGTYSITIYITYDMDLTYANGYGNVYIRSGSTSGTVIKSTTLSYASQGSTAYSGSISVELTVTAGTTYYITMSNSTYSAGMIPKSVTAELTSSETHTVGLGYVSKLYIGNTAIGCTNSSASNRVSIGACGTLYAYATSSASGLTAGTSDKRDKADFSNITKSLEFINQLSPVTFVDNHRDKYKITKLSDEYDENGNRIEIEEFNEEAYNNQSLKGHRRIAGFIAQDVYKTLNETYNDDNYASIVDYSKYDDPDNEVDRYYMRYTQLIPFLTGAIQELSKEIDALKATIAELKSQSINQ